MTLYPKNQHYNKEKIQVGIPQGLPISAVLANLYLLDFDKNILDKVVKGKGGFYRRYSDDIIIIANVDDLGEIKNYVENVTPNLNQNLIQNPKPNPNTNLKQNLNETQELNNNANSYDLITENTNLKSNLTQNLNTNPKYKPNTKPKTKP